MAGISSYDYYRTQLPGWGSSQLRFREPPMPGFRPSSSWSGWDYYRAHAINPDQNLYYTVMNRTRDFGPSGGGGISEARIWQRQIYSGIVNLSQLLPHDIGMGAAYEAYRMWKHHRPTLFDPLLSSGAIGSLERVREGLVGLAIAEASRLWQYTNRPMDTYGLRDCLESAALTAFRISYTVLEDDSRDAGSYAGSVAEPGFAPGGVPMPTPGSEAYDDPYTANQPYRRPRRSSFVTSGVMQSPPSPFLPPGSAISIPGRARSDTSSVLSGSPYSSGLGTTPPGVPVSPFSAGMSPVYGTGVGYGSPAGYPASGGYAGSGIGVGAAGLATSYPGAGLAGGVQYVGQPGLGVAGSGIGAGYGAGGVYRGTSPGLGANVGPGSYNPAPPYVGGGGYGVGAGVGAGYGAGGYGGAPYAVPGGTAIPAQPGSTIVIKSRPRRHSHSHRHRSRSRSADGRGDRYERY